MKKLYFVLLSVFLMTITSCNWFSAEKGSVTVSISVAGNSSERAASKYIETLPGDTLLTAVLEITGMEKVSTEFTAKSNAELTVENIPVGSVVDIKLSIYLGETIIYVGDVTAYKVALGPNSVTIQLKHVPNDVGTKIPEGFVKVTGGTITGAEVPGTENLAVHYKGVFISGRTVTLSSFYMGKYEVTQAQYKSVMEGQKVTVDGTEYTLEASPSVCVQGSTEYMIDNDKDHANFPVENVSWYDAVYYCNALSLKENLDPCYTITVKLVDSNNHIKEADVSFDKTKNGYRLPTEAEWEYAARGGDPTKPDWNYTFSGANKADGTNNNDNVNSGIDTVGWYCYNNITGETGADDVTNPPAGKGTHEVGQKAPNRLGIYDMSGNLWEWCYDSSAYDYELPTEPEQDPAGALSGDSRIYRGGSWCDRAYLASVSYRNLREPSWAVDEQGFRVVRNAN